MMNDKRDQSMSRVVVSDAAVPFYRPGRTPILRSGDRIGSGNDPATRGASWSAVRPLPLVPGSSHPILPLIWV